MTGCAFVGYQTVARRTALAALLVAATAGAVLLPAPVAAQQGPGQQAWPQRPVKFLLPFGAGSATDVAARMMSEKLTTKWGKPVIVENRPRR
jgi:tripartite-type tricarboxylate transporter receptor subunit TctC